MLKLTWRQAAAWRVRQQYLERHAPAGSLLTVASRLCGLHAQVLSCAELTAWARVEGLERREVHRALWDDRTLVKTWAMRGTLHLLPASELHLWHSALATNRSYLKPAQWQKSFGISMDELDRITAAVAEVLAGRVLTREELVREVVRVTGASVLGTKIAESSWGTILKPAAFTGQLCFGPAAGSRVRFTHPDTWLAATGARLRKLARPQSASVEITRRFLAAYGPASVHDLARWWSRGISSARDWIAALAEEAVAVDVEGTPAWMLASDAREIADAAPVRVVRLLPGFDQYVVAASWHAAHLLPGDLRSRVYRPQGWISPVLLVNGFMHGTWRHQVKGSAIEVDIQPFVRLPVWVQRAAAQEAERLAGFFGAELKLNYERV